MMSVPDELHGGKGVRAEVFSHNEGVCRAVKLLKDLTDEYGQREAQDQGNGTPLGHIPDGLLCRNCLRQANLSLCPAAGRQ